MESFESRDRVDMDEEDPQLVAAFLDYANKCGYDATGKSDNTTGTSLMPIQYHVRVFAFAVKYEMEGLRDLAADNFETLAAGAWETLAFARAVQEIYAMTHPSERDLRMIVFRLACEHADVLLDRLDFQAALMAHGELANFSRAVAKRMHERAIGQWQPDWTCRNCTYTFEAASLPSFCISCGTPNPHRYPWGGLLSARLAK